MLYHYPDMAKRTARSLTPYYLALIASYIIWAGAGPIIRLTLQTIPPFTFLFLRFLTVCVLILPYTFYLLKTSSIVRGDYLKIFLLGLFGQSSLILIFIGFKYTTALEGTIVGMLGPILSVAAGHFYYKEKINWHIKLGLLMATMGTILVAFEPLLENGGVSSLDTKLRLFGNLLIILHCLSFVLYLVWSKITLGINSANTKRALRFIHIKPMVKNYSPQLLMSLSFYVGLVTFIPFVLLEMKGYLGPVYFSFSQIPVQAVMGILYLAVLSSVTAYYLFEWALTKIDVKDTAIFSYLQPIFTLPFAYLLLAELPTATMLIGAAVIAVGVLIAEEKKT